MARRNLRNSGAPCEGCMKRQARKSGCLSPQAMRDFLELLLARQTEHKSKVHAGNPPPHISQGCDKPKLIDDVRTPNMNGLGRPSVPLPHGLGHISVPHGAQRVDVRFNCVTSKLPTGLIADKLVVDVDVMYNPGFGPPGVMPANEFPVKKE